MLLQKQVVFLTNTMLRNDVLELEVWSSRNDALRAVKGDRSKIIARIVRQDSGAGRYTKPKPVKKSARARR